MDILSIPFHKFLNIKRFDGNDYIFKIEERPEYFNHIGTIHACVQLSLAEATSGEFLVQQFSDYQKELIPVVRRSEVKYQKPATGDLFAKAEFLSTNRKKVLIEFNTKKRTLVRVKVDVYNTEKDKTLTAIFDWFIIKK